MLQAIDAEPEGDAAQILSVVLAAADFDGESPSLSVELVFFCIQQKGRKATDFSILNVSSLDIFIGVDSVPT